MAALPRFTGYFNQIFTEFIQSFITEMKSKESKTSDENINNKDGSAEKKNSSTDLDSSDNNNLSGGYDLFPERKGGTFKPTWTEVLTGHGQENIDRAKCERRVLSAIEKYPLVKLMMSALESSGCPVDISRHVACEVCDTTVTGGYDIENNQIVVCQNMCKMEGLVAGVLTHEMIHMFDHCKHKIDFTNIDHLACTEIRAANLTHCSFVTAMAQGDASPFSIAQAHQECVKTKAAYSVEAVKHVGIAEARRIVNKVFPQCYADLEPIGRRVRRNSVDEELAYKERRLYGY